MFDMELKDPLLLLTALLAIPIYRLLLRRRGAAAVGFSNVAAASRAPRSWRVRLAFVPWLLVSLAVVAMAVALARPRVPDELTRVRSEGIAIVMVVDRSGSMEARDLVEDDQSVSRLAVVKARFVEFVTGGESGNGRGDDAIGLVAFARWADGLCPLTLDHGSLLSIVDDMEIVTERREDGTALGEGLGLAVERLRKHKARSKIAILLTDGVNNAGDISPIQAAELAKANDVKVYCIGTGTQGVAPFPVVDPFTGRTQLRRMRVEIDEATLKEIATMTGGRYFRATDEKSMASIYGEIDQLERTEITEKRYLNYHEKYLPFVATALALLGLGFALGGTLLRRLP